MTTPINVTLLTKADRVGVRIYTNTGVPVGTLMMYTRHDEDQTFWWGDPNLSVKEFYSDAPDKQERYLHALGILKVALGEMRFYAGTTPSAPERLPETIADMIATVWRGQGWMTEDVALYRQ